MDEEDREGDFYQIKDSQIPVQPLDHDQAEGYDEIGCNLKGKKEAGGQSGAKQSQGAQKRSPPQNKSTQKVEPGPTNQWAYKNSNNFYKIQMNNL